MVDMPYDCCFGTYFNAEGELVEVILSASVIWKKLHASIFEEELTNYRKKSLEVIDGTSEAWQDEYRYIHYVTTKRRAGNDQTNQ